MVDRYVLDIEDEKQELRDEIRQLQKINAWLRADNTITKACLSEAADIVERAGYPETAAAYRRRVTQKGEEV